MKKQMWIYASRYNKESLTLLSQESLSDWYVPLGSTMLKLPDDVIPNDVTWGRLCFENDLKVAQAAVVSLEVQTEAAREKVRKMQCIEYKEDTFN